ncbi:MAG: DedA family protein [Candidatus Marinimicrobia bacterium]|nr:DedA family protein [Candidatus Neomarinimicrobiota bacterium]
MIQFIENLLTYNAIWVYTVLFMMIFFENTLPLVPGDAVLIVAAYLTGRTSLVFFPAYCITILGSISGFVLIFLLTRNWRRKIYIKLPFKIPEKKIKKYKILFQKHENWTLVLSRIIPGSRLFLAITAGLMDISIVKATFLTLIGILIWNTVIFRSVMFLGENWEVIRETIDNYSTTVNIGIAVVISIFLLTKYYQTRFRKKS